ncbi:MAG: phage holin family protein [Oscillatoriales cyanobacterium RM2_1_1]|nr:phage holin family protein [Oscillatoriales cyanobacterium SM2_3_0]NJO47146.1 phage holin family protein [Oscillatoriales cyanobacterium RM2_1_1]
MNSDALIGLVIAWLVTAISLFVIAQLKELTGVEVDSFGKALWSSIVFGLLNVTVVPILAALARTLELANPQVQVDLIRFGINVIIFGLAAWLVHGFRLKWGIFSAVIGAAALTLMNRLIQAWLNSGLPTAG